MPSAAGLLASLRRIVLSSGSTAPSSARVVWLRAAANAKSSNLVFVVPFIIFIFGQLKKRAPTLDSSSAWCRNALSVSLINVKASFTSTIASSTMRAARAFDALTTRRPDEPTNDRRVAFASEEPSSGNHVLMKCGSRSIASVARLPPRPIPQCSTAHLGLF